MNSEDSEGTSIKNSETCVHAVTNSTKFNTEIESVISQNVSLQTSTSTIHDKLCDLNEKISREEQASISAQPQVVNEVEVNSNEESNEISDEIQVILKNWTEKLQSRYKELTGLETEQFESIILEVINLQLRINGKLSELVDKEFGHKLGQLEVKETRQKLFDFAITSLREQEEDILNNCVQQGAEIVSDSELEEFIQLFKSEQIKSLENNKKVEFLINYKALEFSKLRSSIFDTDTVDSPGGQDPTSIIETPKNTNPEIETQYGVDKLLTIFKQLSHFENDINCDEMVKVISELMGGLEKYSEHECRSKNYDKILQLLDSKIFNTDKSIMSELRDLKSKIVAEQWEKFGVRAGVGGKTVLEILETYCISNLDTENFKLEELKYHIHNSVESGDLTSEKIFETVDKLSKLVKLESDKYNLLSFLISLGDEMEFQKVVKIFENIINCQEEKRSKIQEIKDYIKSEYINHSGILDRKIRDNFCKIIGYYLDKFDILVSNLNDGDFSYLKRIEKFQELKEVIDKEKSSNIEERISESISKLLFTNCELTTDLLDNITDISTTSTISDYKRNTKTGTTIQLTDLFDTNGRIKENEGKEVFQKNKTVEIKGDYYRLFEQESLIQSIPPNYEKLVEEYIKELSKIYRKYRLKELMKAIINYNQNCNMMSLIGVSKHFVYYLSLKDENFKIVPLQKFVINFHDKIEHLMICKKNDQEIILDLRIALDLFSHQNLSLEEHNALKSDINSLRNILVQKTYKESGFKLFNESVHGNTLSLTLKLSEIINKIEEISFLRSKILPAPSVEFFKRLNEILPNDLVGANNVSITPLNEYLNSEKNKIIFDGLIENNVDDLFEKLTERQLELDTILLDANKLMRFNLIINENQSKLTCSNLENILGGMDSVNDFSLNLSRIYANKLIEGQAKNETEEKLCVRLKVAFLNAFNIIQIDYASHRKISVQKFMEYLKALANASNEKSMDDVETKFILGALNISHILSEYDETRDSDKLTFLQLFLQMPQSVLTREIYKQFLDKLLEKPKYDEKMSDHLREIILRYYDLFLKEIVENNFDDIQEAMKRLYNNISAQDFIEKARVWLKMENIPETKNKVENKSEWFQKVISFGTSKALQNESNDQVPNSVSNTEQPNFVLNQVDFDDDFVYIQEFLYIDERENLEGIKNFINSNPELNRNDMIQKCHQIFKTSLITWMDELIELRLNLIRDFILSTLDKGETQDHQNTKISDILNVFIYFQSQNNNQSMRPFHTLELICENIKKFQTLEEIKEIIFSISTEDNLTQVNSIIKSSQNLTIDLLFRHVDGGENIKIKNAIDKLKCVLYSHEFKHVHYFCKLFLLQMGERVENLNILIELIVKSKVFKNRELLEKLQEKDIFLWNNCLEKFIIMNDLSKSGFGPCAEKYKVKTVDLLYQLHVKGVILITKIQELHPPYNIQKLVTILNKLNSQSSSYSIDVQKLSKNLNEWEGVINEVSKESNSELSIQQLINSMRTKITGINSHVKDCLEGGLIQDILTQARNLNKKSNISTQDKTLNEFQENDIKIWAKCFKSKHVDISQWRHMTMTDRANIIELLSILIRAVIIYDHYDNGPRNTSLIALLLFLDNSKSGRLGNVYTGEGKTLVTVLLATCLGLVGKRVDVVTSSKSLAIRDSQKREGTTEGYHGFFQMFDLNVSNNCDEKCDDPVTGEEERKNRYTHCDIVYGETGYFQRDYLLSKFFKKDIRDRIGDVLILDEVDSMMIDNASKTFYISHNITDMRHLRDLFIHIWAAVNTRDERHYSEENVEKIYKYMKGLIDGSSNEFNIKVPSTLLEFTQINLKTWIECAYEAKYLEPDNAYIIGDDDSQKQNEIIIMDKDTGVEQLSTKWSNGLHQFIQLKHNCKFNDESLKAVFISNAGYFQLYNILYGMTGTVGESEERGLLNEVYGIDFFEIPRFKQNKFEYDFEAELVVGSRGEWVESIVENIDENMNQGFVVTESYKERMKESLEKEIKSIENLNERLKKITQDRKILDQKLKECERKIEIYETVEKLKDTNNNFSGDISSYKLKMNTIGTEIVRQKESCNDKNLKKYLTKLIENYISKIPGTEYDIRKFIIKFNNKINVTNSNGEEKENLEKLKISIKSTQTEIDYINSEIENGRKDKEYYEVESQSECGTEVTDSRRAVLIICDNISDLNYIENSVQNKFKSSKIYKYDRAYKKFNISNLEVGDIVIATNIAGRGTDLKTSKQIESNGGLHVILTYMPKNLRIEEQAFGRTGRGGNKGTGTIITHDPREDMDIQMLKIERNELEINRLLMVKREQLPKIKLEDELFDKFSVLETELQIQFTKKHSARQLIELQGESLRNKWAIWLNRMNVKLNKVHETGTQDILKEFHVFENNMKEEINSKYGLIDEPGELNKLGRIYLDSCNYDDALNCFDHIIIHHKSFSAIAHYYKAVCIIHKEGGGYVGKSKAKFELKKSLHLLENERSQILSRNQMIKTISELSRAKGVGQNSNCFAKQNEGLAEIITMHINAIHSAIGCEVNSDNFSGIGDESQKVFNELIEKNVLKEFRRSRKIEITENEIFREVDGKKESIQFPDVFNYCKEEVLNLIIQKSHREIKQSSFENLIYTDAKFVGDTSNIITVDEVIKISHDINEKLLGQLEHECFAGKGDEIKGVLIGERGQVKVKQDLIQLLVEKTSLESNAINEILIHLEYFEKLIIDFEILRYKLSSSKNDGIFFGKKVEIEEFCLGKSGTGLKLKDSHSYGKNEIISCLKRITNLSDSESKDVQTNFEALLIQLGFSEGIKFEAINSYKQYRFKDKDSMTKIKDYLETFEIEDNNSNQIDKIDFTIDSRLSSKSKRIIEILKSKKQFKREDFDLDEDGFEMLRAILTDAKLITTSIYRALTGTPKNNSELDGILMRMYQSEGCIKDGDIMLKTGKQGSRELFNRLLELKVIKQPKVNFKQFNQEQIDIKIEEIIQSVFKLKRQSDIGHQVNEYVTGGIGTESKNKELDDKINIIKNTITHCTGTLKTCPEIKVELKDIRTMFTDRVPIEIMDFIQMKFDYVIDFKENRGFDWNCFLCAVIGVAQIVAGVALEILSCGIAHYAAQILISEGIGDIIFAIQAGIEGNFSWKSYGQHKVQSLIISFLTAGVGSFLSRGAQTGKIAVGLATKMAITKAIMKSVIFEGCTAVTSALVSIGADEMSKVIIDEVGIHLIQFFETWTKSSCAFQEKCNRIESKLLGIYSRFGHEVSKQKISACIENTLNQILNGPIGDKIYNQISRVLGGVTKGISMAARRIGGNSKAKLLGTIVNVIAKTVKIAEMSKNFVQLCEVYNEFYDHLNNELQKMEENLKEQQRKGALRVGNIEQSSFSHEVINDMKQIQEKSNIAFKYKIKNGFLQPAMNSLLHMALKPVQQILTSPFANAMSQLEEHINERSQMFLTDIENQNTDRITQLTSRQRKGLEMRGEILKLEDIKNPSLLRAGVVNFGGETIENLSKEHGSGLNIMIKDGQIYAVLPTFKQFCDNIKCGNLKVAGTLHFIMAASQMGRNIEIVNVDENGVKTRVGPGVVKPIGECKNNECYTIAYIEEDGLGHYAPVVRDTQTGNWKIIHLNQNEKTKDACFGQTMVFLNDYEKNRDSDAAKSVAEKSDAVQKYNEKLGKFAKYNSSIKNYYHEGTTVQTDRIVGGTQSNTIIIERKLRDVSEKDHTKLSGVTKILKDLKHDKKNKAKKSLIRIALVNELARLTPTLSGELKNEVEYLTKAYNDSIRPVVPYTLEFSQNKINPMFKSDSTGTGFKYAGQRVFEVGELKSFQSNDFIIEAFVHPTKPGVLVVNNNRGTAAHVIAGVPITRIKMIDYETASNRKAFDKRVGQGTTIYFEGKNVPEKYRRGVKMPNFTFGRSPTGNYFNQEN